MVFKKLFHTKKLVIVSEINPEKMAVCKKLEPGLFYHIYNRGNNKETLFKEEKNYRFFLKRWRKYIEKVANTYSFSLLNNHFHFFIQIKSKKELRDYRKAKKKKQSLDKVISHAFSNFFNSYAKSINRKYGRTGSLFQERFRRKLIDSDEYFTQIINYIHGNAQKHGLIENFCNYRYSSYNELLSGEPTFLMREEIFKWFGGRDKFIEQHNCY
jgi:REP element-mobilizing transposase RayT